MTFRALRRAIALWWDTDAAPVTAGPRIDVARLVPFVAIHVLCVAALWTGWSATSLWVAAALYVARMFAITAFYHRYFSHRAFRASRAVQLVFAVAGASAAQRGPLWWASHHRHHHAHSDRPDDAHSPRHAGVLWSHLGWFLASENFATRRKYVPDWSAYRELRFLDRFDMLVPLALIAILYGAGEWLGATRPDLETSGLQLVAWGFGVSTVALYHATFLVNSLAHRRGTRRYATNDDSRNNLFIAILTLGEGWHNNHHHCPGAARQGFRWWEIDFTWYGLRALAALRLVHDLRPVPASALSVATNRSPAR